MNLTVVNAIFRRNFTAYFSTPTGYVFIFVFVLLSSLAAFWPNEFFVTNLASLDQLNQYLPFILLVFIPAISMGAWAEERRQGTDELLLTIPATDLDVVTGKFLSAVAIYSSALAFSAFCNFAVLMYLGSPDPGLFLSTYIGYWLMGTSMLSIGMVGSFLTGNVTIAFVFGALLNLPLAGAALSNVILGDAWARETGWWSLSEQFRDLGRGVISLPSIAYFLGITAVMLYVNMILIGRRHWLGGRDAGSYTLHYVVRFVSLLAVIACVVILSDRSGVRADITAEGINTLSQQSLDLVRKLDAKQPVEIDAYISPDVPDAYVQVRLNLINTLREFKAAGGSKVRVQIHETPPLSPEAEQAEKLYGITAREVFTRSRSATARNEVYLGVALKSGMDKVIMPFVDFGTPVEYELVRSIMTVSQQKRRTLGVVQTDARLFGGFDMSGPSPDSLLIDELRKQYDVKQVNPAQAITEKYDVLLAVQPSSLGVKEMENFIAAIRSGQPAAIFEDPFPFPPINPNVPGTVDPKQPQGGGMQGMFGGGQQPPQPKGNIQPLWNMLGVRFGAESIVVQKYNPYPRFQWIPEFVFVDQASSSQRTFSDADPITKDMQQLLFLFTGSVSPLNASQLKFRALVTTGNKTGVVPQSRLWSRGFFGGGNLNPVRERDYETTATNYVLAAHIQGKYKEPSFMSDVEPKADVGAEAKLDPFQKEAAKEVDINVVLVADIDCLASDFFGLRAQVGNPERPDFDLQLDNITFVLNTLDSLAGEERFIPIRSRRPHHRTLEKIEQVTENSRKEASDEIDKFKAEMTKNAEDALKSLRDQLEAIKKDEGRLDPVEFMQRRTLLERDLEKRKSVSDQKVQRDFDEKRKSIDRRLALELANIHRTYKLWAVLLPPIPPLLVGLAVFFQRRAKEREGVSRARLR